MDKVLFHPDGPDGEAAEFYVLEQTRIGGMNYILVTDAEEGDGEALILKDLSGDGEGEGIYSIVEDEEELRAVAGVFENMMDDVTLTEVD